MSELTPPPPATDETEVSKGSMLVLRGGLVVASLIVFGFLAFTVISLLTGDVDGDDGETMADFLATTTTEPAADDADTDAEPDDESATGDDTEETDPPPVDLEAELEAFVDEAIEFIETARDRDFLERPEVKLVDVVTMTQIVLDDIENDLREDPEAAAASLAFARAIGFFGPTDEFLDVYDIFVSGGVLGVYFPTSDELLVRSDGELSLMTKATVVHELVHAFDDQHFNLDREDAAQDGDAGWTFGAAAEGSASYVEDLWRDQLSPSDQAALQAEEFAFDASDIFALDLGFLIYQTSVYEAGNTWLERRIATEGIAAIDDALRNPPATSEMVIEPLDASGLDPIDVPAPAVDGVVLWEGSGGQALVAALTFVTDQDGRVAQGWGGDAITVYVDPDGNECLRWDLVADTQADETELITGLAPWASDVGADVSDQGGFIRIDRCA